MKKKLKQILTGFLAITLIAPFFPPTEIFADKQNYVTDLDITNIPVTNGSNYHLQFNWTLPPEGSPETADNLISTDSGWSSGNSVMFDRTYDIYSRNATAGATYGQAIDSVAATSDENLDYDYNDILDNGSIYSFKVNPYHYHEYEEIDDNGDPYTSEEKAPYEDGENNEHLYLTDIDVQVDEASTDSITVTWDNPTYDGNQVFTGYSMQYVAGGTDIAEVPDDAPEALVNIDNDDIIFNGDGTVTYTFSTGALDIGRFYAVTIEPLINSNPIRDISNPTITINDEKIPITFTTNEYRSNDAYVQPALYITADGIDYVRLYWDNLSNGVDEVYQVDIQASEYGTQPYETIGTLAEASADDVNFWLAPYPDHVMSYKLLITYKNTNDGTLTQVESNVVYFDPNYEAFDPYKPIIFEADPLDGPVIDMYWQAFLREAFNEEEEGLILPDYDNLYLDEDLSYKIWVTDDLDNLYNPSFEDDYIYNDDASAFGPASDYILDAETDENTLAYNTIIGQYVTYEDGVITTKGLEDNKVYYIKILATRDITEQESTYEYYSVYIPPDGDIITNPITLGNPPLRIKTDEYGVEEITENSISIEWDSLWYEAYNADDGLWYSVIGVNEAGEIVYGDDAEELDSTQIIYLYDDYYKSATLDIAIDKITTDLVSKGFAGDPNLLTFRDMDLGDANYEIWTSPYSNVDENGGYSLYYDLIENESWTEIEPETSENQLWYNVTDSNDPSGTLENDTLYLIYLRTYTIDDEGNKLYSYNPSYVVGKTLEERDDVVVIPTSVYLDVDDLDSTSVTLRWEYTEGLDYILRYSELASDYTEGGIEVDNDTILESAYFETDGDATYIYYVVEDLFPDNEYFFWVQAYNEFAAADWSSPASATTLELEAPPTPNGLGPASSNTLDIINTENGLDLVSSAEDYAIVEWLRVEDDDEGSISGLIADGEGNGNEYLGSPNLLSVYGAKFNDLIGNQSYYFRVKTRHTIIKEGMGIGQENYSYVVQISDEPYFKDPIEIEVPYYGEVTADTFVTKESPWSDYVRVRTGEDSDEYDGDINPDLYPLPDQDFDIYTSGDTLIYEFLGIDEFDVNGVPTYNVDQRFISNLVENNIYDFAIDITSYEGRKYSNREVHIPYTIIKALSNYDTTLTVQADNMFVTYDMSAFDTITENNNQSDFGKGSSILLTFSEDTDAKTPLSGNDYYASKGQKLGATVVTPTLARTITSLPEPLYIEMTISNRYDTYEDNLNANKLNDAGTTWSQLASNYDLLENEVSFTTSQLGSYSIIGKEVEAVTDIYNSDDMYSVNTYISINDMGTYDGTDTVYANQFNNMVYAIATDQSSVNINEAVSQDEVQVLGRSDMLISGTYVPRQEGISSLVKLYELKTNSLYQDKTPLATSGFSDYSSVSSEYTADIEKAIDIGFLDNDSLLDPTGNMTADDFMYMLNIILSDM